MHDVPKEINIEYFRTPEWIAGAGEKAVPAVMPPSVTDVRRNRHTVPLVAAEATRHRLVLTE